MCYLDGRFRMVIWPLIETGSLISCIDQFFQQSCETFYGEALSFLECTIFLTTTYIIFEFFSFFLEPVPLTYV